MNRSEFLKKLPTGLSLPSLMLGASASADADTAVNDQGDALENTAKAADLDTINPNAYDVVLKKVSLDVAGYYLNRLPSFEMYYGTPRLYSGIFEYNRTEQYPLWATVADGYGGIYTLTIFDGDGVIRLANYELNHHTSSHHELRLSYTYNYSTGYYHSNYDEDLIIVKGDDINFRQPYDGDHHSPYLEYERL